MRKPIGWILGAAAVPAVAVALWAVVMELRGRRLYRADMVRPGDCCGASLLTLRDGRKLAYTESGDPGGTPVLYFHGALGSRLEWPLSPDAAAQAGIRLVAVDRPGCGCSDPKPGRELLDWPDDVRQLVDYLGLQRFRIIAWSAGTPHAMACAFRMPDRVARIDLVGAVVPETYPDADEQRDMSLSYFAALALYVPGTAYALLRRTVIRREREPEWFEDRLASGLSAVDRAVTNDRKIRPALLRSHAAGQSRVAVGLTGDLQALRRPWRFSPSQVKVPVVMWQGSDDTLTPPGRNRTLLREFPDVNVRFFPGEGHFLLYRHEVEILTAGVPALVR